MSLRRLTTTILRNQPILNSLLNLPPFPDIFEEYHQDLQEEQMYSTNYDDDADADDDTDSRDNDSDGTTPLHSQIDLCDPQPTTIRQQWLFSRRFDPTKTCPA